MRRYRIMLLFITAAACRSTTNNSKQLATTKSTSLPAVAAERGGNAYRQSANRCLEAKQVDSAVYFFRLSANAALHTEQSGEAAASLNDLGILYDQQGAIDSALNFYTKALHIYSLLGDSLHVGEVQVNIGIAMKNSGDYKGAMIHCVEAAAVFKRTAATKDLSDVYTVMGNTLKSLNDLDGALNYHSEALAIRRSLHDSTGIAGSYNNIGNIYRYKKAYSKALNAYLASLEIKRKICQERGVAITLENVAETYSLMSKGDLAMRFFYLSLDMRYRLHDTDDVIATLNRMATFYSGHGKMREGFELAQRAESLLARQRNLRNKMDNTYVLSQIHAGRGDYRHAYEYAQSSLAIKDSILDETRVAHAVALEKRYKVREREKDLDMARYQNEQQKRLINIQNSFLGALVLAILFMMLTVYLIGRLYVQSRSEKRKVETLMKDLIHRVRNNLQIVISMIELQLSNTDANGSKLALEAVKGRVQSVNTIHELLEDQTSNTNVRMDSIVKKLVQNISHAFDAGSSNIVFDIQVAEMTLESKIAVSMGLIVNEWLTNIIKHGLAAASPPRVQVKLSGTEQSYCLRIRDNLCPWMEESKTALTGLGLQLIAILSKQIDARLHLKSTDKGNTLQLSSK